MNNTDEYFVKILHSKKESGKHNDSCFTKKWFEENKILV